MVRRLRHGRHLISSAATSAAAKMNRWYVSHPSAADVRKSKLSVKSAHKEHRCALRNWLEVAHLVEAVGAAVRQERPRSWVAQHIVLRQPCRHLSHAQVLRILHSSILATLETHCLVCNLSLYGGRWPCNSIK